MRRGVFGGTFDPVHVGHMAAARAAAQALDLEVVHLVPVSSQPLKRDLDLTAAAHRLAMLELVVGDAPGLIVDDRELRRGGVSYTVDTVRELRREFPGDELFLLLGADAASQLDQWKDAEEIAGNARIVVLTRPGAVAPPSTYVAEVVRIPAIDVSASDIRRRVRLGDAISGMVPDSVGAFIAHHKLYLAGGE